MNAEWMTIIIMLIIRHYWYHASTPAGNRPISLSVLEFECYNLTSLLQGDSLSADLHYMAV
ncbi:MAG: hypothetical protein MJE68_18715, partial [Proteobacteria bacterium]|nr:hypothetical protein [Pseudomonadota bacterium]